MHGTTNVCNIKKSSLTFPLQLFAVFDVENDTFVRSEPIFDLQMGKHLYLDQSRHKQDNRCQQLLSLHVGVYYSILKFFVIDVKLFHHQ